MSDILSFSKMHGCGNDFIVVNALESAVQTQLSKVSLSSLAKRVCNRQFGIGADGLILLLPSKTEDCRMQIINSDGSEPEMCGNGIRCLAKFAQDEGLIASDDFSIETLAGPIIPSIISKEGAVSMVKVDMGAPILERSSIPVAGEIPGPVINEAITVLSQDFHFTGVSMGNPHAVVFVDQLDTLDLAVLGPLFESHEAFPEKVNTEFVQVYSRAHAAMKVWERGAGATLACGTGACAILVAGVLTDRLDREATISLPGGDLKIDWAGDGASVFMTGPAEQVFSGSYTF